ncbi:MAG: DUF3887 domain-containing protein [Chloroflexi bacterium]|nr:DUF3887 domain-containing protein [Chloroflexota bacterium]
MKNKPLLLFVALTIVLLFAGCASQGTPLTGVDLDAVLAFTESKTDNLLAGLKAGDYAIFSADFDADMLKAMTKSQFEALKTDRDAKLGSYVSRTVNTVIQQGDFYIVVYDAVFEKDSAVVMRVVFRMAEPHQVSGLWFNK